MPSNQNQTGNVCTSLLEITTLGNFNNDPSTIIQFDNAIQVHPIYIFHDTRTTIVKSRDIAYSLLK